MMKRFIRRVTAFALSAMLLTAPMAQAQELTTPEGAWLSVEVVVTLEDGSQFSRCDPCNDDAGQHGLLD